MSGDRPPTQIDPSERMSMMRSRFSSSFQRRTPSIEDESKMSKMGKTLSIERKMLDEQAQQERRRQALKLLKDIQAGKVNTI